MKRFLNSLHRENGGFTLIELLIVITILGILAAVALPNFTGITERGAAEAAHTELNTVQTAVDVMMAHELLGSVTPTGPTADMSVFPSDHPLYPNYLRTQITSENYTCFSSGNVTQTITP